MVLSQFDKQPFADLLFLRFNVSSVFDMIKQVNYMRKLF